MTLPRRAITVVQGVAQLRSGAGPALTEYVYPLDLGQVFRWVPEDASTDDGRTVIGASGGFAGNYILVRHDDRGADLTSAPAQTLTVGGGAWVVIPAGTLTQNITLTLGTTAAVAGDTIEVTRLDTSAFTVALVNGGPSAGTLLTMPVSARAFALAQFSGGNWAHRRSGLML